MTKAVNAIVEELYVMTTVGLRFGAYRVRDPRMPPTMAWSSIQFHMTCDNIVTGILPERIALAFVDFVNARARVAPDAPDGGSVIKDDYNISIYPDKGSFEYQVRMGDAVLAVMSPNTAQLFCTLVRKTLDQQKPVRVIKCPAPPKAKGKKKKKRPSRNRSRHFDKQRDAGRQA